MLYRIIASVSLVLTLGLLYLAFSGEADKPPAINQGVQQPSYSGFGK
jgi:hypothetical protein